MNNFKKILLAMLCAMALYPAGFAGAIDIDPEPDAFFAVFESEPLFSEANFNPGQAVKRYIDVTNNSGEEITVGIKAKNYSSCSENCLASQLKLEIDNGGANLYESSLAEFFTAGEKKLSKIGAGSTVRYNLKITFLPEAGNQYQNKEVSFDFDIGIFGAESIGGGGTTGGGGSGGGGGGSYFGGDTGLIIVNENASPVVLGETNITWETNHPATSRVIYSAETEPHVFQLDNPPNYGYAHSTEESTAKVINHSIDLAGLTPGVTYYYRVVSHGSFAVSQEHSFTVPAVKGAETSSEPQQSNIAQNIVAQASAPDVSDVAIETNIEQDNLLPAQDTNQETQTVQQESKQNLFLAALGTVLDKINFCSVFFVIILVVIILLLMGLLEKNENELKNWIISTATTIVLIILYSLSCQYYAALIIVAVVLFALVFAYTYFKKKNLK